jgi:hypothetical protein
MGFGSWAGAFFGLEGGLCLWVITYAFCAGAIAGGIIALAMIAVRRQFRQNLNHTRAIMIDLVTSGSLSALAAKAHERRPRWHRLPYGVPLCIGFVGYLWLAGAALNPDQQGLAGTSPEATSVLVVVKTDQPSFPSLLHLRKKTQR